MSRELSTRGLTIAILFAGATLALGAAFAFRPEAVLEAVPELETIVVELDPTTVVFALAVVLVLLAPILGFLGRVRAPAPRPLRSGESSPSDRDLSAGSGQSSLGSGQSSPGSRRSSPGSGQSSPGSSFGPTPTAVDVTGPRKPVGQRYERHLELATAEEHSSEHDRESARTQLVESLRPIAVTAIAARTEADREMASKAVEVGTWTDDVRAAAFLAEEDGQSIPISVWVIDLLRTSDPFVRSLEHTIAEIETLQDGSWEGHKSGGTRRSQRGGSP